MSLSITNTTPKTTYAQSVKSDEVHSEEDKNHHGKTAHSTSTGLTVPKHITVYSGKTMSAHSPSASTGGGPSSTAPATTPTPAPKVDINDFLAILSTDYLDLRKNVSVLEAQHEIAQAYEAHKAETDSAKKTPLEKILTDLIKKHETTLPGYDPSRADEAKNIKTALDAEKVKLSGHTAHAKAQKIIDGINGGHDGITEARATEIAKANKGLSLWGWAGITALSLIPAGIQWFMGNNASKAAEAKAQAAEDKVTALQEQIQGLLQQLGQVMMSMQAKGEKANAQLTNLVARLIKLQSLKTASAPAHSTASKVVRSDDTSATPANPPVGEPNLDELEKQVKALEQQQASGGGKPSSPSPQGGGASNTGAMPQPATMPQNGQATESPMPEQPETQRIRFHRFPEDARNGAVPTNAFLGDKVITRKVSNTGDRAIIEKDDDC